MVRVCRARLRLWRAIAKQGSVRVSAKKKKKKKESVESQEELMRCQPGELKWVWIR